MSYSLYQLTWTDDDRGGLVVDRHGAVVGGHGEPAPHLVEAPVHHGLPVARMAPVTMRVMLAMVLAALAVVGINLDAFLGHFQTSINAL